MSFAKALKPILIVGQIFGMLPVNGLFSDDIEDLKFRSVKVIYTISLQLVCLVEFIMVTADIFSVGMTFDYCAVFINYGIGIFTTLYMLFQASEWREFMRFWAKNEEVFLYQPYSNREKAKTFVRKINFVGFFIIGFTMGYLKHERCVGGKEEFWQTAETIYVRQRSIVFQTINFHYWYIPIFEWIHISRRVAWAYSEVLCIVFSMKLSMMYQQFNEILSENRHQVMWRCYWKEMLEHYSQLCSLVERANEFVSPLLVVITLADFFFLCERLYRQYADDYDTFGRFYISLLGIFFLVRSFVLFHFCSKVNYDSQEPLKALRDAPTENLTLDFKRLVDLVEDKTRGFSGMNFFTITKGFIFSFIGTVTTYQLVVMQQIKSTKNDVSPHEGNC